MKQWHDSLILQALHIQRQLQLQPGHFDFHFINDTTEIEYNRISARQMYINSRFRNNALKIPGTPAIRIPDSAERPQFGWIRQ
jgi:hypothetical protein